MHVLYAASVFQKCAQTVTQQAQLKKLGNILASPIPRENTYTGLIAILQFRVNQIPQTPNWAIGNKASKAAVTQLYNAVKAWYVLLPNMDINSMVNQLTIIINQWDSFKRNYLTNDLLMSLSADSTNPQVYTFWYKLHRKINETLSSIDKIQKDVQKGVKPSV
jgi:hypothetical protein